ncbi:hypothetical protein TSMEX_008143 [Taenia solium]|eukprot:TsM_000951600 transcript=TsM_000951600 gene=TsM_000951600
MPLNNKQVLISQEHEVVLTSDSSRNCPSDCLREVHTFVSPQAAVISLNLHPNSDTFGAATLRLVVRPPMSGDKGNVEVSIFCHFGAF